tara:strand:+ start:2635 stop:4470 length:1836 start_codon:yes stop_codon:yes gene_type:complete
MPQEFKPQYNFTDDRLNELKQLFPEAWEDGVFNVDTLKTLIGDFSTDNTVKEHFGLNWVGKQDARKIAAKPPTGTLKPCLGEGVNEDSTENIFIEGENLEVLKILRKSYMDKIKMIYIDPPYNTGNDFIYNDTFADSTEDYLRKTGEKSDEGLLVSNPKSSGKYHANWLSFMYPRLRLAKDLLKEDGVIFISIDDNEVDNLKKLTDEIFGEENCISIAAWQKVYSPKNQARYLSNDHEYVLIYCKNINSFEIGLLPRTEEMNKRYKNPDKDPRGNWKPGDLVAAGERSGGHYIIKNPKTGEEYDVPIGKHWAFAEDSMRKMLDDNRIYWGKNYDSFPSFKQFLTEVKQGRVASSLFQYGDYGHTDEAKKDVVKLFGEKGKTIFETLKPVRLIKNLFRIANVKDNDIVFDFFLGSGTTAQAVNDLILEDNIKLNYVVAQIPDKIDSSHPAKSYGFNKLTEIAKARIKLAIEKYCPNQGFKIFKQSTSTIYKWQDFKSEQDGALPDLFSKMELAYKNPLQDGVTTQDFITEVILQEGFPLTAKQEEVSSGIFKITHDWLPYNLYATMLYSFKNTDFDKLQLQDTDHFVCLDKAFEGNDALKQDIDNQCKLFTI